MKYPAILFAVAGGLMATPLYQVRVIPKPAGDFFGVDGWSINQLGVVGGVAKGSTGPAFIGTPDGSQVLPGPNAGGLSFGINDHNVVAYSALGLAYTASTSGFTINNPAAGFPSSQAASLNNAGYAAGSSYGGPPGLYSQATVWDPSGNPALVNVPGTWTGSAALDINNSGQIAGVGFLGPEQFPFIGTVGSVTVIPLPGLPITGPMRINDNGDVLGGSGGPGGVQLWMKPAGAAVVFLPAAATSLVGGKLLNNHRHVVGHSTAGGGWIWDQTNGLRYLNDLIPTGWSVLSAHGINDAGQIVVQGFDPGGKFVTMRLDPVPEPGTWLLSAAGLAWLLRRRAGR